MTLPGPSASTARVVIGVAPAGERARRRRLLDALERVLPVRFVAAATGDDGEVAGLLLFGAAPLPAGRERLPRLRMVADERAEPGVPRPLDLAGVPELDPVLRGARLHEAHAGQPLAAEPGDTVLAAEAGAAMWVRRRGEAGEEDVVAAAPLELGPAEALRDRLGPGRCLALLALHAFAQRVAGPLGWTRPPQRAAFVIDDPNLHWRTYGHLSYPRLARHAAEHGYHLAVAMVPLDGWFAHPSTARLFRAARGQLSVTVHGDEHAGPELGRLHADAEALGVAHRALCRVRTFERRFGVPVSRVMVPPHERLTEQAARALLATGFEAATLTRPYPWVATPERPWLDAPADVGPLAGWPPADAVAGGLPMLLRSDLRHPREDLVLKALLGQPLILYGHHADIRDLDVLAEAAAHVNALGDVRWGPLDELARAGVETRRAGEQLHVRPYARRFTVPAQHGVAAVVVDRAELGAASGPLVWRLGAAATWEAGAGGHPIVTGGEALEVQVVHRALADDVAMPRRRVRPLVRRAASELRDRLGGALAPVGAWR